MLRDPRELVPAESGGMVERETAAGLEVLWFWPDRLETFLIEQRPNGAIVTRVKAGRWLREWELAAWAERTT